MTRSVYRDRLRIVPEFRHDEHEKVGDILFGKLDRRLSRWEPEQVELEISVKDRDSDSQRVALECWIAGLPKFVGTAKDTDIDRAVTEARDEVWRQIDRHVNKAQDRRRR